MATLGNPKNTIEVLQKYHFNFQKKFGQNFLINTSILEEIIDAAEITKEDFVLEIGPGIGTMTQYLCEAAREVVAVEIDTNLIPILGDTLSAYDNVEVMNADILKVDIFLRDGGAIDDLITVVGEIVAHVVKIAVVVCLDKVYDVLYLGIGDERSLHSFKRLT